MADDGTGFLSGFTFTVAGAASSIGAAAAAAGAVAEDTAAGAGGGGGFTMSRDEMTSMLTKAKGTLKLISEQLTDAAAIAQIEPPGDDAASGEFTDTAIDAGKHYLGHLGIQQQRYQQLIAKLEKALGLTVDVDEDSSKAIQATDAQGEY